MKKYTIYDVSKSLVLHGTCPYCTMEVDIEVDPDYEDDSFEEECPHCYDIFEVNMPEYDGEWENNSDDDE